MKRLVKVVKLGDFSLPQLSGPLDALSSEEYCAFELEPTHVKLPAPDYKIGGFIEEYSFDLLLSIMQSYRQERLLDPANLAIGLINRRIEKNYFGCSSAEHLCSVISIFDVEEVIEPLNLNQFLVSEIVRHAVALMEEHWWHPEPRRCFYDFCGDKRDIVASFSSGALCDSCRSALSDAAKDLLERNASLNLRMENNMPKHADKILFVSADPSDASRLGIQKELRNIQDELQRSVGRAGFLFETCLAARPSDLSRTLLAKPRPRVLHFSGHGTRAGAICLEDGAGQVHPVSAAAIASLLEPISADLDCVVLNACYARKQADTILAHVPFVVGMSDSIDDRAAMAYSVGFYQALFNGEKIPVAHRLGCAQIHMVLEGEHEKPVLLEATTSAQG